MRLTLHLGAHKTATTFLQRALERNAPALAERGVGVAPLQEVRDGLSKPLKPRENDPKAARRQKKAATFLKGVLRSGGVGQVILSDENLLGEPEELVRAADLYPDAARRLEPLAGLLDGQDVRVLLAVRHLGHYSRSLYSENLRWMRGEFVEPDAYKASWENGSQSWVTVIEVIRHYFPGAEVVVWDYDTFKQSPQVVLDCFADGQSFEWDLTRLYKRRSMTNLAVKKLLEIGRTEGTEAMRAAAGPMHNAHKPGKGRPLYRMWTGEQNEAFQARQAADLAAIAQMGPEVSLLSPG